MIRWSERELARELEDLDNGVSGGDVTFADFCEFYQRSVANGSFGGEPTEQEFFGRELTEAERAEFWKRLIRVWDGEEEPPC